MVPPEGFEPPTSRVRAACACPVAPRRQSCLCHRCRWGSVRRLTPRSLEPRWPILVRPPRIERGSPGLQPSALTLRAKDAKDAGTGHLPSHDSNVPVPFCPPPATRLDPVSIGKRRWGGCPVSIRNSQVHSLVCSAATLQPPRNGGGRKSRTSSALACLTGVPNRRRDHPGHALQKAPARAPGKGGSGGSCRPAIWTGMLIRLSKRPQLRVEPAGVEPASPGCKPGVSPLALQPQDVLLSAKLPTLFQHQLNFSYPKLL